MPSKQSPASGPENGWPAKDRVTPALPFCHVCVDYFDPFTTIQGSRKHKRYGALFTCLFSRAVHIEVANSLETYSFLTALRRFIVCRGLVNNIYAVGITVLQFTLMTSLSVLGLSKHQNRIYALTCYHRFTSDQFLWVNSNNNKNLYFY